jgi:quercetin dioxygenase-like cupin family protein
VLTVFLTLTTALGSVTRLVWPVRLALVVVLALALGIVLGVAGDRILDGDGEPSPAVRGGGTLSALPAGPVDVRAETVVLPAGFRSRHMHGGPTFNTVESGSVEIEDENGTNVYEAGNFFFEPARAPHTIRVLADARLDVVRLLPPGAPATIELP